MSTRWGAGHFSENPILLAEGHVIPALQDIKTRVTDAFKAPHEVETFYEDHVSRVVDWELLSNSSWYKQRFTEVVSDPRSLLRLQAPAITDAMVEDFVARYGAHQTLGRNAVRGWAQRLPSAQLHAVLAVRELIYHLSGARVVNCEGALPQEDYVDYDIADLSQQRTRLSEEMIFMKLYVELVRDELCQRPIPLEVLDLLTFEDVLEIRAPLADSGFSERYDALTQAAIAMVRGGDEGQAHLVEDIERLDAIRTALSETFREVLEGEVGRFAAKRGLTAGPLASSSTSVALGLTSLVPGLGPVATALALGKDSASLFFNITHFGRQPRALHEHIGAREQAIAHLAKRGLGRRTIMVDAVRLLTESLATRLRL